MWPVSFIASSYGPVLGEEGQPPADLRHYVLGDVLGPNTGGVLGMVAAGVWTMDVLQVGARVAVGAVDLVESHVEEVGELGVGNCSNSMAMLLEHHHNPLFDLLHRGGSMLWLPSTAPARHFARFLNWLSSSVNFAMCALAYPSSITWLQQAPHKGQP